MRTTSWGRVRRYFRFISLLLLVVCLLSLWLTIRTFNALSETRVELKASHIQLDQANKQLSDVNRMLEDNRGKIDGLVDTVERQDKQIKAMTDTDLKHRTKLFDLELARNVEAWIMSGTADQPLWKTNVNDIYLYIFYAQKYQEVYKKKYPSFAQFYDWRAACQQIFQESKMTRTPKLGFDSEQGAPQILEYQKYRNKDGTLNPHREAYLYPMLCKLGYKRKTYGATIDLYLASQEVQVDCYYEEFTRKLRDNNGDFVSAVVAYNGKKSDPLNSKYWLGYRWVKHLWGAWIDDAKTKSK